MKQLTYDKLTNLALTQPVIHSSLMAHFANPQDFTLDDALVAALCVLAETNTLLQVRCQELMALYMPTNKDNS
jgi:hypothetical protein